MGHSSSGCKVDGEKLSQPQRRQKRRIWWLKHSPFGPEPKHDKRLSWLNQDADDIKRALATREPFSDEKDQITEHKIEEESFAEIGFNTSSNLPSIPDYSLSEKHVSAPTLSPNNRILISIVDVQGKPPRPLVSRHGVKALEDIDSKEDCSDGEQTSQSPTRSVRRSHSATFYDGTRFSSIRRSARNFVTDLDEFRREMSNPEVAKSNSKELSPRLFEFRTSLLKVSPSSRQMKAQYFIDSFVPILDKKPDCFKPLLNLDFDVFDISQLPTPFDAMPLVTTAWAVFTKLKIVESLRISWTPIVKFLINVEEGYNNLPYHSKWHAADVVANLGYFLNRGWFRKVLSPVHQLTSILAAAGHDVDHNGQTNQFHRLAKTPIGVSYPESNLEYHHIAKSMGIRNLPGCDWPAELSSEDKMWSSDDIWTLFSTLILRTDPAMHDPEQKPFSNLAKGTVEEQNQAQPPALMEILHFADISNSVKPTRIAKKWAKRFYREFVNLGVESRKLKLNIPIFKDVKKMPSLPDTQIFFISKVCLPSFTDLCVFMPEAQETVKNLEINLAYWKDQKEKLFQQQADAAAPPTSVSLKDVNRQKLVPPGSQKPSSHFSRKSSEAVATSDQQGLNLSDKNAGKHKTSTKQSNNLLSLNSAQPAYREIHIHSSETTAALSQLATSQMVNDHSVSSEQKEDWEDHDFKNTDDYVISCKDAPELNSGNKPVRQV